MGPGSPLRQRSEQRLISSELTAHPKSPITVMFVSGWGRSGSTLLSRLLGQIPGFLAVGELRYIWDRGLLQNLPCACSLPFRECPFWSQAADYLTGRPRKEIERLVAIRDTFKTRHCLWRSPLGEELSEYVQNLGQLYHRIQEVSGCQVIIDSSKFPSHGVLLDAIPDIDLFVLHLIRDSRAVAFSWKKRKLYQTTGDLHYMSRQGLLRSSVYWMVWNAITEFLWSGRAAEGRYLQLRYEELTAGPLQVLGGIQSFVNQEGSLDFFAGSHAAYLNPTHEVSGNPSRFAAGMIEILKDEEWCERMPRRDRILVSGVTAPFLYRYGYFGE